MPEINLIAAKKQMIEQQLVSRGILDEGVLRAMSSVPRERFVDKAMERHAYEDGPLPIGKGQTISQPYVVALMTEALDLTGNEKILEVGTGSGYQTAILAELAHTVYTVERLESLLERAKKILKELGYTNVLYKIFNGSLGWNENAPYDGIIVTAGAPGIPEPLIEQLVEGGRLIIPIGNRFGQELIKIKKTGGRLRERTLGSVKFVSLIGEHGWSD
ncbi:MAG: protein-L-isoaspartate(D-aspartate) O-methyltransferase [Syntrophales bacterium]|jgi:protein-L-isoaspartate(D-aspartate) O-methyltransferase|nr:protein-L-isoaspartate(D-aspartate) O-methyltransferase [Syntrophales bacterium]MDY0044258.1 protein-L-isoaspartate(D-aspartate) O-methyltransferase [Syntrophales bacterium]